MNGLVILHSQYHGCRVLMTWRLASPGHHARASAAMVLTYIAQNISQLHHHKDKHIQVWTKWLTLCRGQMHFQRKTMITKSCDAITRPQWVNLHNKNISVTLSPIGQRTERGMSLTFVIVPVLFHIFQMQFKVNSSYLWLCKYFNDKNHWIIFIWVRAWLDTSSADGEVIKWKHFSCYWAFVRGFTGPLWIPLTKASDAELWCFLSSAPE